VSKYQSRKRSLTQWLSLVLPGVGHLLLGRAQEGTIYLFLLILFLIKLIWRQEWVPSPLVLNIWPSTPWMIAAGFFFVVYYGFVQYRMTRILSKGR